jgi:hypothetical protein
MLLLHRIVIRKICRPRQQRQWVAAVPSVFLLPSTDRDRRRKLQLYPIDRLSCLPCLLGGIHLALPLLLLTLSLLLKLTSCIASCSCL